MKKEKVGKDGALGRGFFERINSGLDIDCDMLVKGFMVEWRGKKRVEISGVKRIFVYTENNISFVTPDGIFCVTGRNLKCSSFKCRTAVVEGDINSLGFENGGENGTV